MSVYTIQQMKHLESLANTAGHSYASMMQAAGRAVAKKVIEIIAADGVQQPRLLVLAGPGNNGGDGLVAARVLSEAGYAVTAVTLGRQEEEPLTIEARHTGVLFKNPGESREILNDVDIVVDALFGTGLSRPIEGEAAHLLQFLAAARANRAFRLIGVDGPSGLNGDRGSVDPLTVAVDETVTFAGVKVGMVAAAATDYVGKISVADIGIPAALNAQVEGVAEWLTVESVTQFLPERPRSGHKGTFGTVLVVGGSLNYLGAPALSALAAGHSGAGLVTLAVPRAIQPMLGARADLTFATWLPLAHDFGAVRREAALTVRETLDKVTAMVIGPGLGTEETTQHFVYSLLGIAENAPPGGAVGFVGWRDAMPPPAVPFPPIVIDADALNALAAYPGEWWRDMAASAVLTPHPAELGRLLKRDTAAIQADRIQSAREAASRFGQIVVLKGAYTVVAAPDGRAAVNSTATSALAKAGSGDVLAGIIGALLAQGVAPYDAARLAVVAHGRAGQQLEAIGARGAVASELLPLLARVWKAFE